MLLKFLVILLLIFLTIRLSARLLFPWMLRYFMKRVEKKFYEANPGARPDPDKDDGEISIVSRHASRELRKKSDKKMGDYVDFEEINEN